MPIILIAFGIVFSIASGFIAIDAPAMFARSGSVLSFVSVVVQFILSNERKSKLERLLQHLLQEGLRLTEKYRAIQEKDRMHNIVSRVSVATGLIGTIIWGFVLLKKIENQQTRCKHEVGMRRHSKIQDRSWGIKPCGWIKKAHPIGKQPSLKENRE